MPVADPATARARAGLGAGVQQSVQAWGFLPTSPSRYAVVMSLVITTNPSSVTAENVATSTGSMGQDRISTSAVLAGVHTSVSSQKKLHRSPPTSNR